MVKTLKLERLSDQNRKGLVREQIESSLVAFFQPSCSMEGGADALQEGGATFCCVRRRAVGPAASRGGCRRAWLDLLLPPEAREGGYRGEILLRPAAHGGGCQETFRCVANAERRQTGREGGGEVGEGLTADGKSSTFTTW